MHGDSRTSRNFRHRRPLRGCCPGRPCYPQVVLQRQVSCAGHPRRPLRTRATPPETSAPLAPPLGVLRLGPEIGSCAQSNTRQNAHQKNPVRLDRGIGAGHRARRRSHPPSAPHQCGYGRRGARQPADTSPHTSHRAAVASPTARRPRASGPWVHQPKKAQGKLSPRDEWLDMSRSAHEAHRGRSCWLEMLRTSLSSNS